MRVLGITFVVDRISFRVAGTAPQRFLSLAAEHQLRLWGIRCTEEGYTALARGVDLAALEALAAHGGWKLTLLSRLGPGPWAARALRRPGIPLGLVLFLLLLRFLSGFIWCMDYGDLEGDEQAALHTLLASNGICEGARPNEAGLAAVRRQAAAQTDRYGWVSINFTAGCLAVESTPSRFEAIAPPVPEAALYAAAEGEVLRVETESGFALVAPGHYVAAGQLLVDCVRTRRSGSSFSQGASGNVIARVMRDYTATQPATVVATVPGCTATESLTLHFMGQQMRLQGAVASPGKAAIAEWLPLRIGRLALPGYLQRVTLRPQQKLTLHHPSAQAAALAARACRRQLMAEFPDAVIETQQRTDKATEEGVSCTIRYTFCANIAKPA